MKQLGQFVIINRDAKADYSHDEITHVFSVRHLNDSRFYSIPLLLDVFTLKISTQSSNINRTQFSIRRNQNSAGLVHFCINSFEN